MTLQEKYDKYYDLAINFCKKWGYILLSEPNELKCYNSILKYICPIHGKREVRFASAILDYQCYECSRSVRSQQTLKSRQEEHYNKCLAACDDKGYELLSQKEDIINQHSKIIYICPKHGEKNMLVHNMEWGEKCPDCANEDAIYRNHFTKEQIMEIVKQCGSTILNPDDYINSKIKNLYITCPKCEEPFLTSLVIYSQHGGQLCPNCESKMSLGEAKISKYLDSHNIEYKYQHWFPDCRDINPLPFDFYISKFNLIIEFDGRQHFVDTGYFTHDYKKIKYHDNIKDEYCNEKHIHLIRISEKQINHIDEILDSLFNDVYKDIV